jgi:hypothetical protein
MRFLVIGVFALLGACASTPDVSPDLASARTAIQAAERANAGNFSPEVMSSARERLERAQAAQSDGDAVEAAKLASEATVQAEYALAQAELMRQERARNALEETVQILEQETGQ